MTAAEYDVNNSGKLDLQLGYPAPIRYGRFVYFLEVPRQQLFQLIQPFLDEVSSFVCAMRVGLVIFYVEALHAVCWKHYDRVVLVAGDLVCDAFLQNKPLYFIDQSSSFVNCCGHFFRAALINEQLENHVQSPPASMIHNAGSL